ncbi:MAG: SurA N-terminal domain-containing protein [Cyclobacteriaceae bacterium]|nr:SurA N-terminal domain-containing protein [Cyclobacteriaceae bacterium HetDA_MAG_MS6]
MALINTLRQKAGKIVIVFVGFSMLAFILADLFQNNSALLGGTSNEIGEMAGATVTYEEFQDKVDDLSYTFALNTGNSPTSDDLEQIKQNAWQALLISNVFEPQFKSLGITVTNDEIVDMVQGNNIDPQIRQFFTDPNTGEFSRDRVIGFLQSLNSAPPQQRDSWLSFEAGLRPSRMFAKYENLLEKTKYATKYEGIREYRNSSSQVSADYLYVPFFSVNDSLVSAKESEFEAYLSEHQDEYQREESKDISYVTFPIQPSSEDSALVIAEIEELKEGLASAQNDSTYASINSDGLTPFSSMTAENLPESLRENGKVVSEGFISTPELVSDKYVFYKLSQIVDGNEYFLKASHILFKPSDDSNAAKADSKREARKVLRDIRNGADFGQMASIHGTDGTASRGGDLGWFGENSAFVQEFKDAAFAHRGSGLLRDVVETEFGFHIIKITEPKTNRQYKVAQIEKELFVSDRTLNDIYRNADLFAADVSSITAFNNVANERSCTVLQGRRIGRNDKRVGAIANARTIVYWLYNKASVGEVSKVFELEDQYVVAVQTGEQEEGTARLSDVRNEINRKVLDQKKADYIIKKLEGAQGAFEEIAESYGEGARAASTDLTLSSSSFPNVGYAPEAIGTAFSLEEGERTRPFKVGNGVLILEVTSKTIPEDREEYDSYKTQALAQYRSFRRREEPRTYQNVYDAIVEFAEIEDGRYKFY